MRKEAVARAKELLKKTDADWQIVETLMQKGKLIELGVEGKTYYVRRLPTRMKS